jgi:Cu2+-exporting ATPase
VPGCGILGDAEAKPVAVGSGVWLAELGRPMPIELGRIARRFEAAGNSLIHVGWAGRVRAVLALGDMLLAEARPAVQALRRLGLHTVLLTGDRAEAADRIAAEVGLDRCQAGLSPDDKRACLEQWRGRGGQVAMVGDGLNDGPRARRGGCRHSGWLGHRSRPRNGRHRAAAGRAAAATAGDRIEPGGPQDDPYQSARGVRV